MVTAPLDETSVLRILGSSPLEILQVKYGIKYLTKSKKQAFFRSRIKKWVPQGSLEDFAKDIWDKWVLYNELANI